jgi:hypothetical protein
MTLPDRVSILGPLHQVMESRLDVLKKVCQLQGRLNLILEQRSKDTPTEAWKVTRPQVVYRDDSSDEELDVAVDDADVLSEDEWEAKDDEDDDDGDSSSEGEADAGDNNHVKKRRRADDDDSDEAASDVAMDEDDSAAAAAVDNGQDDDSDLEQSSD